MLDVRRLRLLHALSVHGTVTAAAEALHVTSPAVSQQLAALEREAGVALVERDGRRLALTRAGQVLAAHTQLVLDQLAAAEADLAGLRTRVSGAVRLGAFVSAASSLLPRAIRSLRAAHGDDVELLVHEMEPEASLPALRRGEIDIAIVHAYNIMPRDVPVSCESHELLTEQVCVALPMNDPLVQQDFVDLAVLADRPWIMPRTDASCHELAQRACGAAGFVPRAQAYCDDFGVMCGLVEAGLGLALVPSLARRPGVALRPMKQPIYRTVSAVVRHRADGKPAVQVVLDQLRQV
ncbi:LysR family transcriptional regulator [Lentzea tibetensis]|uniref:LysR family transcriptional regulator n=1 Tax=Lentzea tibetensis TaxID=2591470 RepID=A0A563ETV8_9PSEU|nr:LysR family transcriptional regulator [Lentzea tibetensis]TWP51106.1 LysR family transcriptional regulator [Lentzea tibetensis]